MFVPFHEGIQLHESRIRLDGVYECGPDVGQWALGERKEFVFYRIGRYGELRISGHTHDFHQHGQGVTPEAGKKYRITIEEVVV